MSISIPSTIMRLARLSACAMLVATLVACASGNAERRPYFITEALDRADKHLSRGQASEAAELYRVVQFADPINTRALQGLAAAGRTSDTAATLPTWMGINHCQVTPKFSLPLALALYPFNRLLDVADVVSFHFGLEGGALLDVHATRAMQAGFGGGGGLQMGWWQKRDLGLGVGHVGEIAILPLSAANEGYARFGTGGIRSNNCSLIGINAPQDRGFQTNTDYWGVGGRFIILLLGVSFEIHPVEIADAVGGFFLLDFLHDDLGQARSLKLDANDKSVMESLINSLSSSEMNANLKKITNPSK